MRRRSLIARSAGLPRLVGSGVAASVVASLLVVAAPPRALAADSAPTTKDVTSAGDAVTAAAAARAQGHRVEVLEDRSLSGSVFANPEGSFTSESAAGPVHARKDGSWVPIDTSLSVSADGRIRAVAVPFTLSLSGGGDLTAVDVTPGSGQRARWQFAAALPAPTISGSSVRYPNVQPGVDLLVTVVASGFEVSYVLTSRPTGTLSLAEPLLLSGLTAAPDSNGNPVLNAAAGGQPVVRGGTAFMFDATSGVGPDGAKDPAKLRTVTQRVSSSTGGATVTLSPDPVFLQDPTTVFPVTVDPFYGLTYQYGTYVYQGGPTTNYNGSSWVREGLATALIQRTLLRFQIPTLLTGKHITVATLKLLNDSSTSCGASTVIRTVSAAFDPATVTWSNQPAFSGPYDAKSFAAGCALTWHSYPMTDVADTWINQGRPNYGLELTGSPETDSNTNKIYRSATYGGTSTWTPTLSITYNTLPGEPRGRSVTPCFSTNPLITRSVTPKLTATASDADGGTLRYQFQVFAGTNPSNTGTPVADSGLLATSMPQGTEQVWTVPTGKLVNGSAYAYRARVYDGTDYGAWSDATGGWPNFTVDTSAPVLPAVTSSTHPSGGWAAPTTASFTLGNGGSTDVLGYNWWLDSGSSSYQTATTLSVANLAGGPHHLKVQSEDGGGNLSPVFDYPFNVGIGAVTSPVEGDRTQRSVNLSAAAQTSYTAARFQFRRGDTDTWTDIPLVALKTTGGGPVSTLDQPITGGVTTPIVWDLTATPGIGVQDGPAQVQAVLSPGTGNITPLVHVTLDQSGSGIANSSIGPGSVNLLTGNFGLDSTDTHIGAFTSDLTLSRSFNSRAPSAGSSGIFGPGWVSSVGVDSANSDYTSLTVNGTLVNVLLPGGGSIGFTQLAGGTTYKPEVGSEDLTLTSDNPATTFTLADLDGNKTLFTQVSGTWMPSSVTTTGSSNPTTSTSWEVAGGVTRPTRLLAPAPANVTCNAAVDHPELLAIGCRALSFTYAPASTTPPAAGTFGDYPGRLSTVTFWGWTSGSAVTGTAVASYSYDSTGRLAQSWDPRITPSLKTSYAYDGTGLITTVTPPGVTGWTLTYDGNDPGRLLTAQQVQPAGVGTAVTTMLYNVPITGVGAPYDLSNRANWGQNATPFFATAVVPPIISGTAATTADLAKAAIHYLDSSGREVNTAGPAPTGQSRISTTEFDGWGNTVRTLSPTNRQRALDSSPDPTVQAATSRLLDSESIYSTDGTELLETYGPEHYTMVGGAKVRARAHTVNTYDEGAPGTGGPFRLVTTTKTGARVAGAILDSDVRTSTTSYDWTLRQATSSTTDPAGLALTNRTGYDTTTGLVTSTTLPGSSVTTTAQTTTTTYYTAAANGTFPRCGGTPQWAGLVCRTGPGGAVSSGPVVPATYATYNLWNTPAVVTQETDSPVAVLRTTTSTFDAAGRVVTGAVSATTSPVSVAVPTTTTVYNPITGAVDKVTFTDTTSTAREVDYNYDAMGRQIGYKDADSSSAPTAPTFDLQGRSITNYDGAGSQTRAYDPVTGDLTQLVDSEAGTFTASYSTSGDLTTVGYPGAVQRTNTSDETGSVTNLSYDLTSNCPTGGCNLLIDQADSNIFGQQINHAGALAAQTYSYDAAGRLTGVQDQDLNACTSRAYFFDPAAANGAGKDSDRTGQASSTGAIGACPSLPTTPTVTHSYDTADRITDSGYVYDGLGRTTTIPAAGTLTGAAQSPTFYANDLVATIGSSSYTLDPTANRFRQISTSTGVVTRHFDDGGDSPAWSTGPNGTTEATRNIGGPAGDLVAIRNSDTTIGLQLADLRGDVVATITPGAQSILSSFDSTEFGAPRASSDIGARKYGWLGAKTREADNPGGIILMGVRLYNPSSGRFLQTDPIKGGSANDYDYVYQDPINKFDLGGTCWGGGDWCHVVEHAVSWVAHTAWKYKYDIAATALSFVPVAGEVVMAARAVQLIMRARKAQRLLHALKYARSARHFERGYQESGLALRMVMRGHVSADGARGAVRFTHFEDGGVYRLVVHPRSRLIYHFGFEGL